MSLFDLTDDEQRLREKVRDFADSVVAPAAYEYGFYRPAIWHDQSAQPSVRVALHEWHTSCQQHPHR